MSQAVLSRNLTKEVQWEVAQIADKRCLLMIVQGGFKCKLKPPKKKRPDKKLSKMTFLPNQNKNYHHKQQQN